MPTRIIFIKYIPIIAFTEVAPLEEQIARLSVNYSEVTIKIALADANRDITILIDREYNKPKQDNLDPNNNS
jgi:hypothetical protein